MTYKQVSDNQWIDENKKIFVGRPGQTIEDLVAEIEADEEARKLAPPAKDFPLINRVQFKSMLALLGKSVDDVMNAIDAVITDPTQNTIAKVKVTDSDRYARDNELFTILAPSMQLTDEKIDAAWDQAVLI